MLSTKSPQTMQLPPLLQRHGRKKRLHPLFFCNRLMFIAFIGKHQFPSFHRFTTSSCSPRKMSQFWVLWQDVSKLFLWWWESPHLWFLLLGPYAFYMMLRTLLCGWINLHWLSRSGPSEQKHNVLEYLHFTHLTGHIYLHIRTIYTWGEHISWLNKLRNSACGT